MSVKTRTYDNEDLTMFANKVKDGLRNALGFGELDGYIITVAKPSALGRMFKRMFAVDNDETRIVITKLLGAEAERIRANTPSIPQRDNLTKRATIKLSKHEIQSGLTRVERAEGLLRQLPEDHDGRNTWLLNYGIRNEATLIRKAHEKHIGRNLYWNDGTQCLYPVSGGIK